ncbi:DinB family protein [Paenibacillus methanolicus]|uniref:Putative damage-inducible protein DinB n=1 Tax=Paenibacillus methanolicus TaxID=582686 RepID=A0A5S5CG49_9BACL|nr:DinB family protein [Paenibacillus methanolicus]TYP78257.1 putative damage-inducible protein DinB [Paenibacillus methanolicus]
MHTIRTMFAHLDWANRQLLESLRSARLDEAGKAAPLFLHVLQAERIWLTRLNGEDSRHLPLWGDDVDLDACASLIDANGDGFRALLDSLPEEALDEQVSYRSQAGDPFETTARDILTHVALHGQYHRGQINAALRAGGFRPAAVDYILFARLGDKA